MDYSLMAIPKPTYKKKNKSDVGVRDRVKKRDHGRCRFPGCGRTNVSLHHVLFRSQFPERKHDEENLICLCPEHHNLSKESPHQSDSWRRFWEREAAKMYPEYYAGIWRENK